jgi:hypothetical protein
MHTRRMHSVDGCDIVAFSVPKQQSPKKRLDSEVSFGVLVL